MEDYGGKWRNGVDKPRMNFMQSVYENSSHGPNEFTLNSIPNI